MESKSYLSRVFQTLVLFQAFWILGLNNNILGPTLIDLEIFLNESRQGRLSYLFIVNGMGTIFGCAISNVLPKRHLRFRLGLAALLASGEGMVSTVIPSFVYFAVFFLLQSIFKGFIITYGIELCNELWQKKGVPMQFVLTGTTLGCILAPLVAGPFLADSHVSTKTDSHSVGYNTSNRSTTIEELTQTVRNWSDTALQDSNITGITGFEKNVSTTNVRWAYVVLGCITTPAGVAFLLYWCRYKDQDSDAHPKESEYERIKGRKEHEGHKLMQRVFLMLVVLFSFSTVGVVVAYSALLTVFGVEGPLHLSKPTMMKMTSAMYVSNLAGKLSNTGLVKLLGTTKVITLNLVLLLLVTVPMVVYATHSSMVLLLCTLAFGFLSAPFQGAILAFASEYVYLTPGIISLISISFGMSNLLIPYTALRLMQMFWPSGHFYMILGFNIYMIVVFLITLIIGRFLGKRQEEDTTTSVKTSLNSDGKILTCTEFIHWKRKEYFTHNP